MRSVESAFNFLQDLAEYYEISDELDPLTKSCAIAFYAEPIYSQEDFARRYWSFAQLLHDIDCQTYSWDGSVSDDIDSDEFELSLCGRAVFTTTLNPQSPRFARKIAWPVWVMNQTEQFNHLRRTGKFTNWQTRIRDLDSKFDPSGEPNPILVDHGYGSAADQLAGSKLETLDFVTRRTSDEKEKALSGVIKLAKEQSCPDDIVEALKR